MAQQWIGTYEQELDRLNLILSQKPSVSRNVDTIYTRQAIDRIKLQMDILGQTYEFSQLYLCHDEFQDDSARVNCVKRIVKLRFRCKNKQCEAYAKRENRRQKADQLQNCWTSYYGLVEYKFIFDRLYRFRGQGPKLTHSFRLYKQRCKLCKQWGKSGLIDTILDDLINLYSLFVQNFMELRAEPSLITWRYKEKKGRMNDQHITRRKDDGRLHMSELCQACELDCCWKIYRPKADDKPPKKKQKCPDCLCQ